MHKNLDQLIKSVQMEKYKIGYIYGDQGLSEITVEGYEFKFSKKVKSKKSADAFARKTIQMIEDYICIISEPVLKESEAH